MDISNVIQTLQEVARRRIASGEITLSDLAWEARIPPAKLSSVLASRKSGAFERNFRTQHWDALMKALGVTIEELVNGHHNASYVDDSSITLIPRSSIPGRQRFIAIAATASQVKLMDPVILPGYTLIIDRQNTKLIPFCEESPTLYAVMLEGLVEICYLHFFNERQQIMTFLNSRIPRVITLNSPRGTGPKIMGVVHAIVLSCLCEESVQAELR